MCLQCLTNSKLVVDEVIPGYSLHISRKQHELWGLGWYGLIKCNNPITVISPGCILREPGENCTDQEYDWFITCGNRLDDKLTENMDCRELYQFVKSCTEGGYNPQDDGTLGVWLLNHIAEKLEKA